MTAMWKTGRNPSELVRWEFGSKYDDSGVRNNLAKFIIAELAAVGLGANTFDEAALQVVLRAVQGNLRLCANLCYASLVAACLDRERIVAVSHVNSALQQPHWRSHEALLKQQVKPTRGQA
ncbi:hypothetical protein [Massilia antarctica]|uniref:hypothetical protein n=2 Tax=Massilia antarctica TaxID=2765360 RepID=UPI002270AD59|nr:hypothetical protein [Massilia sp. H27-R4]MCY0915651.1 hypothetical protein [Massilia sp. H27-R4]